MYLIAIDIDGTLVSKGNSIEADVVNAVREESYRDVTTVLTTARPYEATHAIYKALDLSSPMACLNGALIYAEFGGELLQEWAVPREAALAMVRSARSVGGELDFYVRCGGRYSSTSLENPTVQHFIRLSGNRPEVIADPEKLIDAYPAIHKLGVVVRDPQARARIEALLREQHGEDIRLGGGDEHFIGVVHRNANKQFALQYIAQHLGVPQDRTVAIGDSDDDLGMIEWAGWGVAMGSAPVHVRQRADFVVRSAEEKGVAQAIEELRRRRGPEAPAPEALSQKDRSVHKLRYGVNPFIKNAYLVQDRFQGHHPPIDLFDCRFYADHKVPSYNNIVDIDATIRVVFEFEQPTAVCTKHTSPAVAASHASPHEALRRVLGSEDESLFGSVIGLNFPVDVPALELLREHFLTSVVAPSFCDEAKEHFRANTKVILVEVPELAPAGAPVGVSYYEERAILGGRLLQKYARISDERIELKVMGGGAALTQEEVDDVLFGLKLVKFAKTNAAVTVSDRCNYSISNAQTTRKWAIDLALQRCRVDTSQVLLVNDGRLSHPDALEVAAGGGLKAIVAPRGIVKEEQVAEWADRLQTRVVLVSHRLFYS